MAEVLIEVKDLIVKADEKNILENISFSVYKGEAIAIAGASGAGKTILGKVLAGQLPYYSGRLEFKLPAESKSVFVSQQHDFRDLFSSNSYYQRRFDQNYGNDFPVVEDVLKKSYLGDENELLHLASRLGIEHILKSKLIELSNGEGKRLQIARALLQKPQVLVLDNPFIGLDDTARRILHSVIDELVLSDMLIIIITSSGEIPKLVKKVIVLESGSIKKILSRKEFLSNQSIAQENILKKPDKNLLKNLPHYDGDDFLLVVKMKDVTVRYGDKVILEGVNWKVEKGEKWALTGANGSGKSTLLSLINGDNPQAYTNEVYLFERKRGTGESIWDIKKKIGYVSPELHNYFQRDSSFTEALALSSVQNTGKIASNRGISCLEAVASGYNDQVGSSQNITDFQKKVAETWMKLLGSHYLKNVGFYDLSLGEQRIIMLARALVKNPPVLILDEPCQGLDKGQVTHFKALVDMICEYTQKTLIYVSHYPEDIPSCVNRKLVLDGGKVVYCR